MLFIQEIPSLPLGLTYYTHATGNVSFGLRPAPLRSSLEADLPSPQEKNTGALPKERGSRDLASAERAVERAAAGSCARTIMVTTPASRLFPCASRGAVSFALSSVGEIAVVLRHAGDEPQEARSNSLVFGGPARLNPAAYAMFEHIDLGSSWTSSCLPMSDTSICLPYFQAPPPPPPSVSLRPAL